MRLVGAENQIVNGLVSLIAADEHGRVRPVLVDDHCVGGRKRRAPRK
jgi:hypothetical protein